MGALDGRVAVITGAGRGIGREHARLFAAEGAQVVVNDSGADVHGVGSDGSVAESVVDEIVDTGGVAVASGADAATMDGAAAVLDLAVATFGRVDVLVNNAGILRDRMFVNMSEDEWDASISGHLKSTFCMTRALAAHWRDRSKADGPVGASVVNTTSTSGLIGQVGQSNYGAAKSAIAGLTVILAEELGRYGVRVNAIAPGARTRMTADLPGVAELVRAPADPAEFDQWHPANIAPLVAWLARRETQVTGQVFYVRGDEIRRFLPWSYGATVTKGDRWSVAELDDVMAEIVRPPATD